MEEVIKDTFDADNPPAPVPVPEVDEATQAWADAIVAAYLKEKSTVVSP